MTLLTTLPVYPVPTRAVQLTFTLTESGANYVRVWITDAPNGSELRGKLDESTASRIPFHTGDAGTISFTPDVGGIYILTAQEYTKGSSYGGAYEGDPNGGTSETKVGSEATLQLTIGQRVTQQAGTGSDTATLVLWVFGSNFQATTLATHGESSPALIEPTSNRAATAAAASSAEVAALAGAVVSTALGTVPTIVSDMVTQLNAHINSASVHNAADNVNDLPVGFGNDASPKSLPAVINRALNSLRNHFTNIDTTLSGDVDSASFHLISTKRNDRTNLPLVDSVGDLATAYAAIGDIARCHEAHRGNTTVHSGADASSALAALPLLLLMHRAFFTALASLAPAVPATANGGVVTAVSVAGFTEG